MNYWCSICFLKHPLLVSGSQKVGEVAQHDDDTLAEVTPNLNVQLDQNSPPSLLWDD
jgi:hypothetical protein